MCNNWVFVTCNDPRKDASFHDKRGAALTCPFLSCCGMKVCNTCTNSMRKENNKMQATLSFALAKKEGRKGITSDNICCLVYTASPEHTCLYNKPTCTHQIAIGHGPNRKRLEGAWDSDHERQHTTHQKQRKLMTIHLTLIQRALTIISTHTRLSRMHRPCYSTRNSQDRRSGPCDHR